MSAQTATSLHRHPFVRAIEADLRDACNVQQGDRLLLAVSGGADSVALLRAMILIAQRPHWKLQLSIAHVDHHLRSGSAEDARFVAELARQLGLECDIETVDVPALVAQGPERNIEKVARDQRYQSLRRAARRQKAHFIVTAHHADDQLESLLMSLMRGAAAAGLSGIRPHIRLNSELALIRPMLRTIHAMALEFLEALHQPFRHDETNDDRSRVRARLRAQVLPTLRDIRPDAAAKAHDAAERMAETADLLTRLTRRAHRRLIQQVDPQTWRLSRRDARRLPRIILTGLIRRQSRRLGVGLDQLGRRVLNPIVRAVKDDIGSDRQFNLTPALRIIVAQDALLWVQSLAAPPVAGD